MTTTLDTLRAAGWQVAVHNDYKLNGVPMTFWLFTHSNGRWVKGEGETDDEALDEAAHNAAMSMNEPVRMQEPKIGRPHIDLQGARKAVVEAEKLAGLLAVEGSPDVQLAVSLAEHLRNAIAVIEDRLAAPEPEFEDAEEAGDALRAGRAAFVGLEGYQTLLQTVHNDHHQGPLATCDVPICVEGRGHLPHLPPTPALLRALERTEPPEPAPLEINDVGGLLRALAGSGSRILRVPMSELPPDLLKVLRDPRTQIVGEPEAVQRVRAWVFGDETLFDPYTLFTSAIFAKPITEVTALEIQRVRGVTFFLAYGGDHQKAADELGVPVEQVTAAVEHSLPPVDFAVVVGIDDASDGNGIVIDEHGDNIEVFVENESMYTGDMKLGHAPPGISIWEGVFHLGGSEGDAKPEPKGRFRPPTETEWAAIREGRSPWELKQ